MPPYRAILDEITVRLPNGWEFTVPAWAIELLIIVTGIILVAAVIRVGVRFMNRRDDPRRAKRPPDHG